MSRAVVLALAAVLGACASGKVAPVDSAPGAVDAAIDGNGCSTQPCSILPQCGCNGNTACDVDVGDNMGTACRPINAAGTETSSCNGPNECDRGFVCLGGSAFASCKKYCTGDADCGLPRGKCVFTINGDSGPIAGAPNACSSNCDPTDTTAAGCPSTMKCTLYTVTKASVPINIADCSPAGAMVQGGDCTAPGGASGIEARCAKGFQCVKFSSESVFKCRKLCTAGTSTCGANTCVAFTPVFTLDAKDYGVCGP